MHTYLLGEWNRVPTSRLQAFHTYTQIHIYIHMYTCVHGIYTYLVDGASSNKTHTSINTYIHNTYTYTHIHTPYIHTHIHTNLMDETVPTVSHKLYIQTYLMDGTRFKHIYKYTWKEQSSDSFIYFLL